MQSEQEILQLELARRLGAKLQIRYIGSSGPRNNPWTPIEPNYDLRTFVQAIPNALRDYEFRLHPDPARDREMAPDTEA